MVVVCAKLKSWLPVSRIYLKTGLEMLFCPGMVSNKYD